MLKIKSQFAWAATMTAATFAAVRQSNAAAFTSGNIVVEQIGLTGSSTALSSNAAALQLDEFAPTGGNAVQTIALPTADSGSQHAITDSGSATSEGQLSLSGDGRYLLAVGYDAAPNTAKVASTTSAATARVAALIDANGNIDTSTAVSDAFSANNIRGGYTPDGTNIYLVGAESTGGSGIHYTTVGSATSTPITTTIANGRVDSVSNGQLYLSSGSGTNVGINAIGSGTPTTSGQSATLTAADASGSPYGFYLTPDGTTLYVADDSTTAKGGGLQKYVNTGSGFTLQYTVATGLTAGLRALTGTATGTGPTATVTMYGITADGTTKLVDFSELEGATTAGSFTTLETSGTNTEFRGVAFAPGAAIPTPEPTSMAVLYGGVLLLARCRRRRFHIAPNVA